MYLYANRYVSQKRLDDNGDMADNLHYNQLLDIVGVNKTDIQDEDTFAGANVGINIGYWRKANQIHGWFVDNCGEGDDNCRPYTVDRHQLEELKAECQEALATKNTDNLPRTEGCFFGSNEIDEYYFEDLKNTITIIDRALSLPGQWSYEYQASW